MYDWNGLLYLHTLNHQALKASLVDNIRFISASRYEFVKRLVHVLLKCIHFNYLRQYFRLYQGSYGFWKSLEFDLSIFQVWEKFGKKKAEYEQIFVSRLERYKSDLVFYNLFYKIMNLMKIDVSCEKWGFVAAV